MFRITTAPFSLATALALLVPFAAGQDPTPKGYPERDALTPFRNPTDVYAPPDELFRQLRIMQNLANRHSASKSFDIDGREVIDHEEWRRARRQVEQIGLNAGMLAQMMRLHRDGTQRATAFYAAFYVPSVDDVLELIAHIPGEPLRRTREAAFRRAIPFLRAHLGRRFGDLSTEQQDALRKALPEIGSPVAKARGLVRAPQEQDYLHTLRLVPFLQLLDIDDPLDQAQALWFLKETFKIRLDLATLWLEPSLPRIRQLLLDTESRQVRAEAIGLFEVIGPDDLPPAPEGR
ncbi:MAG TPA: hypothetical protein ENI87_05215, partial [bacterium]|nr:hypothetical protein [bacterium]